MKTDKQITVEALQRAEELRRSSQRKKRMATVLAATTACIAIIVVLSFAMPAARPGASPPDGSGVYSATLFAAGSVGGYVLVGIVGFVLGVLAAFFASRWQRKK